MKKKILDLIKKKNKSKIVSLSTYSKNISSIVDSLCDLVLVGDSLGSVLYNYKSTREVTLNTMIEHSKSVRMGVKKSLMVVDMPHNTYRNPKEALINAKKIISKTKCDAVKLEGGQRIYKIVKNLIKYTQSIYIYNLVFRYYLYLHICNHYDKQQHAHMFVSDQVFQTISLIMNHEIQMPRLRIYRL